MLDDSGDVATGTVDARKLQGCWYHFSCIPGVFPTVTACSKITPLGPNSFEASIVLCINCTIPIPLKEKRARKNGTNDFYLIRGVEEDVRRPRGLGPAGVPAARAMHMPYT